MESYYFARFLLKKIVIVRCLVKNNGILLFSMQRTMWVDSHRSEQISHSPGIFHHDVVHGITLVLFYELIYLIGAAKMTIYYSMQATNSIVDIDSQIDGPGPGLNRVWSLHMSQLCPWSSTVTIVS